MGFHDRHFNFGRASRGERINRTTKKVFIFDQDEPGKDMASNWIVCRLLLPGRKDRVRRCSTSRRDTAEAR